MGGVGGGEAAEPPFLGEMGKRSGFTVIMRLFVVGSGWNVSILSH